MASKPVMLLGNLASIVVTIAGILQVLSWTIAGATILALLSITTLAPTRGPRSGFGHSTNKKTGHTTLAETKPPREKPQEKQAPRPHLTPSKPEQKQVPKNDLQRSVPLPQRSESEFQKAMSPKITPPKTIPTNVSPTKPFPTKPGTLKQEAIRPIPVGTGSALGGAAKPVLPKIDPNSRVIAQGDYATFDLELDQRAEVTCEVTASAPVNVYIMDADNLNSLDLGEEFWSESGEEGVEKTALHFVAPQKGKWFLVVENTDNKEASTRINIRKIPPRTSTTG